MPAMIRALLRAGYSAVAKRKPKGGRKSRANFYPRIIGSRSSRQHTSPILGFTKNILRLGEWARQQQKTVLVREEKRWPALLPEEKNSPRPGNRVLCFSFGLGFYSTDFQVSLLFVDVPDGFRGFFAGFNPLIRRRVFVI